jgi:HD-like signal output (HDOD) protein
MTTTDDTMADNPRIADQIVRTIPQSATLPEGASDVIQLTSNPDTDAAALTDIINFDPALGIRILKVANSSFYSMGRSITSLDQAIVLLGNKAIRNIALAVSLARLYRDDDANCRFKALSLWKHSVGVATAASLLASKVKQVDTDEAFLAGLLHDIGIIVEMQACRRSLEKALHGMATGVYSSLREAERDCCGATHEQFGEALCRQWALPAEFIGVTGFHHEPLRCDSENSCYILCQLIHVADILAARQNIGLTTTVESLDMQPEILALIDIDECTFSEIEESLTEASEEFDTVFCATH